MHNSMPVPVSPSVGPGLMGRPSGSPEMLMTPPVACAIMSNARLLSNGLPSPNAGIDLANDIVAETEPLDRPRREVLDEHVGLACQVERQLVTGGRLQIDGDRLLVGVEDQEIEGIAAGLGEHGAPRIAGPGVLDLHDLGAKPSERLRARRPRLELREVQHP